MEIEEIVALEIFSFTFNFGAALIAFLMEFRR